MSPALRCCVSVIAGVLALGCNAEGAAPADAMESDGSGGAQSDSGDQSADSGSNDGDRSDGLPPVESIVIPMRPLESGILYAVPTLTDGAEPRLEYRTDLTLALGEGYPLRFVAELPTIWAGTCGPGVGSMNVDTIEVTGDAALISQLGPRSWEVTAVEPGTVGVSGRGEVTLSEETCGHPPGTVLGLDLSFSVRVEAVRNSRVRTPCGTEGEITLAPRAQRPADSFRQWFSAVFVDANGDEFLANNAAVDAQMRVELTGRFDAGHATPESLQAWTAPSEPGVVEIATAFASPRSVEVVGPERVTDATVSFQIAGFGGGSTPVVSGEAYGPGWARSGNRLAPMIEALMIGGEPLCSEPDARWFEVRTSTPDTCEVVDLATLEEDAFLLYGRRTGQAGRFLADGRCRLELHAPDFADGALFPRILDASFSGVDGLHNWP